MKILKEKHNSSWHAIFVFYCSFSLLCESCIRLYARLHIYIIISTSLYHNRVRIYVTKSDKKSSRSHDTSRQNNSIHCFWITNCMANVCILYLYTIRIFIVINIIILDYYTIMPHGWTKQQKSTKSIQQIACNKRKTPDPFFFFLPFFFFFVFFCLGEINIKFSHAGNFSYKTILNNTYCIYILHILCALSLLFLFFTHMYMISCTQQKKVDFICLEKRRICKKKTV